MIWSNTYTHMWIVRDITTKTIVIKIIFFQNTPILSLDNKNVEFQVIDLPAPSLREDYIIYMHPLEYCNVFIVLEDWGCRHSCRATAVVRRWRSRFRQSVGSEAGVLRCLRNRELGFLEEKCRLSFGFRIR